MNMRLVLPATAALALGVWGVKQWSFSRAHESTDNAQVEGRIVPIVAKVGGYVLEVPVGENRHVTDTTLLLRIDPREYDVRLAQAEADLAAARAAAGGRGVEGQAVTLVRTATSQRDVGTAQVAAVRAALTRAESDYARAKELVAKQIVSASQLDAARAAFDAAQAELAATERQVRAATSGIAGAQAGVRLAEARLAAAEAARDQAALQRAFTVITAPLTGTVSRKQVEPGQLVQPGQTLMSVVSDTGLYVSANVKETQLARIRPGQRVQLEVDAYDGASIEGEVESIASATGAKFALLPPDNATGNFTKVVQRVPVRIRITKALDAERPLRPGMSVVAHIVVQ